jgi:predicted permease
MPASFYFPDKNTQVWEPATVYWRFAREHATRSEASARRWGAVGRLASAATIDQARAEMRTIGDRLARDYPQTGADFPGFAITLLPILDTMVAPTVQLTLWILLGAVGCVLLIACANISNLLLARGAARERELAIRAALGAGKRRLARLLLVESALVALGGGIGGIAVAWWAVRVMGAVGLADVPRLEGLRVDSTVLMFTAAVAVACGLLFGLVPAWKMARGNPGGALKAGGAATTVRVGGTRGALVVVECSLAMVLLVAAGLMIRSALALNAIKPGFDGNRVLLVRVALAPGLQPARVAPRDSGAALFATREDLFTRISDRLAAVQGVQSVGAISSFFPTGAADEFITVEGRTSAAARDDRGQLSTFDVSPHFFRTMGVPLVRGRFFTRADALDKIRLFFPKSDILGPPSDVRPAGEAAIVNETFARRYFPNADPIGSRFYIGELTGKHYWYQIVGVVGDMRRRGLEHPSHPEWYGQLIGSTTDLLVRTTGEPLVSAGIIRSVIQSVDKHLMVLDMSTVDARMDALGGGRRLQTRLLMLFASAAMLLAALGIYGIVRYTVADRTREIGVRVAFGATPHAVVRLVVLEGVRLPLLGLALGAVLAFASTRLMAHLLFEVSAVDPSTYAGVAVLLGLVACTACWLPARRAARLDPVAALRGD